MPGCLKSGDGIQVENENEARKKRACDTARPSARPTTTSAICTGPVVPAEASAMPALASAARAYTSTGTRVLTQPTRTHAHAGRHADTTKRVYHT